MYGLRRSSNLVCVLLREWKDAAGVGGRRADTIESTAAEKGNTGMRTTMMTAAMTHDATMNDDLLLKPKQPSPVMEMTIPSVDYRSSSAIGRQWTILPYQNSFNSSTVMPRFSFLCSILFLMVLIEHRTRGVGTAEDTCSNQEIEDGTCQQSSSTNSKPNGQRKESQQNDEDGSVWKIPPNVLGRSQEAAERGQMGQGTRIISNFMQDPRILKHLTDHREWFACYEDTRDSKTYWYDKNDEPNSIWEYMATQLWKDQPFLQAEDFAGFEIWCNILTPEGPLTWHVDKDQVKYQKSRGKELSLPLYGSVFYGYPHEFTGGYLELLKYDTGTWPEGMDEPDPESIERIGAEYNRLVVFNASKFHRVSPIHSGSRVTLAVNVWKERPGVL